MVLVELVIVVVMVVEVWCRGDERLGEMAIVVELVMMMVVMLVEVLVSGVMVIVVVMVAVRGGGGAYFYVPQLPLYLTRQHIFVPYLLVFPYLHARENPSLFPFSRRRQATSTERSSQMRAFFALRVVSERVVILHQHQRLSKAKHFVLCCIFSPSARDNVAACVSRCCRLDSGVVVGEGVERS